MFLFHLSASSSCRCQRSLVYTVDIVPRRRSSSFGMPWLFSGDAWGMKAYFRLLRHEFGNNRHASHGPTHSAPTDRMVETGMAEGMGLKPNCKMQWQWGTGHFSSITPFSTGSTQTSSAVDEGQLSGATLCAILGGMANAPFRIRISFKESGHQASGASAGAFVLELFVSMRMYGNCVASGRGAFANELRADVCAPIHLKPSASFSRGALPHHVGKRRGSQEDAEGVGVGTCRAFAEKGGRDPEQGLEQKGHQGVAGEARLRPSRRALADELGRSGAVGRQRRPPETRVTQGGAGGDSCPPHCWVSQPFSLEAQVSAETLPPILGSMPDRCSRGASRSLASWALVGFRGWVRYGIAWIIDIVRQVSPASCCPEPGQDACQVSGRFCDPGMLLERGSWDCSVM